MNMRQARRTAVAVASALFLATSIAARAQAAPAGSRIPTVTRLVKIFSELESALAAKALDPAAAGRLLDPDFESRDSASPGEPVPRGEWVRRRRAAPRTEARIDQMAVHDFGEVAVVSFREVDPRTRRQRLVVDCWKRAGDSWRLAVRYAGAEVGAQTEGPIAPPKRH